MTKEKKLKVNKELFVSFKLNANFIDDKTRDVSIKVADPRLKDTKYFSTLINGLVEDTVKIEGVKNGDKIMKLSQQFAKRIALLQDVLKLNSPEDLREAGKKELQGRVKDKDSFGFEQFATASKDSFNSLLARVSLIGTCLYEKKDVFTVKKDKDGKLKCFTSEALLYPEVQVPLDIKDPNGKKTWQKNPNTKEFAMSGDKIERFYKHQVLGKVPKSKINADTTKDKTKGSPSDTNGATLKTIAEDNNFDILNKFINLAITKDPQKFVNEILDKDFANIAGDTKDPLVELLKPNNAKMVFNFIREIVIHGNKNHPETNDKINQIINSTSGVSYDNEKKEFIRLD